MLDRKSMPAFGDVVGFDLINPTHLTLGNGVNVYIFNAPGQELTRLEWIFGNVYTGNEDALRNRIVNGMLLEGTSKYKQAQIAEQVDFHGAFLVPEFSFDHSALSLFSMNKHLPALLPLVYELLTDSIFPDREFSQYIRNQQQSLKVSLENNAFLARRKFNEAVFGENRYGKVVTVADYDRVKPADLRALRAKQYVSGNCTIILAGKIDDTLLGLVDQIFGQHWAGEMPLPEDETPQFDTQIGQQFSIPLPNSVQSAIRIGHPTIQRSHPDFAGLQVMNTLFGGYFGSRLMANIREDKGYTYGIYSGIVSLKHHAYLSIGAEVGSEVTTATLAEIEKEISRLRQEEVSEDELKLVKNFILGSLIGSLENVFSHADKFKNVHFAGLDNAYYTHYLQTVNAIDSLEILRLANTYLDYDKMVKVIVG